MENQLEFVFFWAEVKHFLAIFTVLEEFGILFIFYTYCHILLNFSA
jgi:hypothetical protein